MDAAVSTPETEPKILSTETETWRMWATASLVFLVGFTLAYLLLQATPGFVSTDDYYHARAATEIIEQRRLRLDFPWLPLTILRRDQFVDHHLLYHLYIAPFAYWGSIAGAKFAQSLIIGGLCLTAWWLLHSLKVRCSWLWAMALFGVSAPFLYRSLMIRTQAAAVLMLVVALYLLFTGRHRWLIVLAFTFTWLYDGFILLPVIVLLDMLAGWIVEQRIAWRPILYTILGIGLGVVINPYFPENILFIVNHLGEKVDIGSNIRVGSEWYPYTSDFLLSSSLGAFIALAAGVFAPSFRKTGRDRVETTLLAIALLTLVMAVQSRRFIEYFPAFALLFCAVAWGRDGIRWRDFLPAVVFKPFLTRFAPLVLSIPIALLGYTTFRAVESDIRSTDEAGYMAGAANWLRENTESSAMVFQTDWDDFPYLYFYNTHNIYLIGLDPTYLQVADPSLWDQWVPITQGAVENPSTVIQDVFGANYVVSDTRHDAFAQRADADSNMRLVYRDDNSMVWEIETDE